MSFGDLLEAALAGTQRHTPPAVLPFAEAGSAERRLLRAASYAGVQRLAGRPPEASDDIPEQASAPPEARPEVGAAAGALLGEILDRRPELLEEWLALAAAHRQRAPFAYLADLLEYARTRPDLEASLIEVGGERLAWLAQLNPAWSFAARSDAEEEFAFGRRDQRLRALKRIRRADPARARAELTRLNQDERGGLLQVLADGLSVDDEPLLEQAVRSARKDVRGLALELIRRIPGSRFGQRWSERARGLVILHDGPRIELRLPAVIEPAWEADGLEPRPPRGTGPTAWLLQQTLALTPPSIWPPAMLEAIVRSEWAPPLLNGLAEAAVAYASGGWCETLLAVRHIEQPAELIARLEPARAEIVCRRLLDSGALETPTIVRGLERHTWSAGFSRYVFERLAALAERPRGAAIAALSTASLRLDPDVLDLAHALSEATPSTWVRPGLLRLVQTLEARARLRAAFTAQRA